MLPNKYLWAWFCFFWFNFIQVFLIEYHVVRNNVWLHLNRILVLTLFLYHVCERSFFLCWLFSSILLHRFALILIFIMIFRTLIIITMKILFSQVWFKGLNLHFESREINERNYSSLGEKRKTLCDFYSLIF